MTNRILNLDLNMKKIIIKIGCEYLKQSFFMAYNFINQAILLGEFHVY